MSSSSLVTSTLTRKPPVGAGSMWTTANFRVVWRVDSNRSYRVAESGLQGSIIVPVSGLSVRIVPASRFSDAMGKYWFTTATVLFHTVSKSDEGTTRGLGSTGRAAKIRSTFG